ncbi:uncharacterized protein LOC120636767 [Pararge aegeria]|uniref:uncharacterized protein LOC120636767 n=2 Tax=Pararge aegeria TaxID=116150 RepID=UPI0019D0D245|nr:uncharacterized protein LOC120636767 [Pararge aegeria]
MSPCIACKQHISPTERLTCSLCPSYYHYGCIGLSKENFSKLSSKAKAAWKCPDCKMPRAKGDNTNTPVKTSELDLLGEPKVQVDFLTIDERLNRFEEALSSKIINLESSLAQKLNKELTSLQSLIKQIPDLIKTVEFMSNKFDQMQSEIQLLKSEVITLRADNTKLQDNVRNLDSKMLEIEQRARESNLDLQCIPEFPKENLTNTAIQLGKTISYPIMENDIISCTRIAKVNASSSRPRSVILKLSSPRKRDEFLSACLKFNKSNPLDKLNSSHLGIAADKTPIYVSEHLSPANRSLHAMARSYKKEKGYKYLWVRHGRVMMRKNDSSPAIWIKNSDFLMQIKS